MSSTKKVSLIHRSFLAPLKEGLERSSWLARWLVDAPSRWLGRKSSVGQDVAAVVADVAMRRLFAPEYQALHPELIARCKERFLAVAPRTFHSACQALATLDLREHLASVQVPALVLVGEMDEATPPPMSRELAAGLPDARLVVLPGCAHVPQLQAPELFLATLEGFV